MPNPIKPSTKPPSKPWSFLAYIAGDNNLSAAGLTDISEMCQVGANAKVHAAVQIDTAGEHDGSVRYEVSEPDWTGKAHRVVIERLPESDSGDPLILRDFLRWGFTRYAAEQRLVVVWNHGSGFHTPPRRNIGYDDRGTSIDMPELNQALSKAGVTAKNPLAILGFDACLMCLLEICHHVAPYTRIVVGSQQTEPNDGWPYDAVLRSMQTNPKPEALAKAIVESYIDSYKALGEEGVTQSAVATVGTEAAMLALSNLGRALVKAGAMSAMRTARAQIQCFEYADYVDVIHLAQTVGALVSDPLVKKAAATLGTATGNCLIAAGRFGDGVEDAHGVSCWFPADANTFHDFRGPYTRMRLGRSKALRGWLEFLDAYFSR
jgi:hypothetical protein